jgi:hypothetical protein
MRPNGPTGDFQRSLNNKEGEDDENISRFVD